MIVPFMTRACRKHPWLLVMACFLAIASDVRAQPSKEYQLKAAFLYNFAKFVEWPARSFASPESPFVIGVYRADSFGGELEKAVKGRKIGGHPIVVSLVPSAAAARQTQILFVGAAQDGKLAELKGALQGSPVLTVGESPAFAKQGGMITFALKDNSLRFTIDNGSAEKAGVKISSQLRKLAQRQEGGTKP
ncbi:MAG: YfiR family protein [Verrucomicrobiaceae bacterium]|nr:MAG: YfiR family protein [Verrucomicrobiaceae bacterium]